MHEELKQKVKKFRHILDIYKSSGDIELHPFDIADLLTEIYEYNPNLYQILLHQLPRVLLAEVLLELPKSLQKEFYSKSDAKELAQITEELDTDEAVDLIQDIEEIDEKKANEVILNLPVDEQDTIKELISYSENEAGAYMQTELFYANIDESIKKSIDRLKRLKESNELDNVHHVFIVDKDKKFLGMIPLEDLILYDLDEYYKDILDDSKITISVKDSDDIKKVVELAGNYDLSVIPVVDSRDVLLGRITSDDIHDIIEEDATEQIYHLAGVDDDAEEQESIWKIAKSRGLWLGINLLTAISASLVIGLFDSTIESIVALAVLMPIVASMGGNAGTQTLTVTVRQMALGDIEIDKAKKTIFKEVLVSLMNGLAYALIMGIIAYLWFNIPMLGVVIALAMIINLLSAGFFGAVIPIVLQKFGIDPAIGSTVLLTTVTDVVGFFSFLGLATLILL